MTEQSRTDLKELQKLDIRIKDAKQRIADFDPLFEEVEEPALILEGDLNTTRNRLQEMKLEERRLGLGTEEKRTRQKKLEERLGSVRNLREEAAVSAELEMVKRSLQNDEQEALTLMDQVRKIEERLEELEAAFAEATALVEPKRQELLDQRAEAQKELESLRERREGFVGTIDREELKIYEAIRRGGRAVAVADLTVDGACGNCFGMVPLQLKNEILQGDVLIRCEACGVILSSPDPEAEEEAAPASDEADVPAPEADAGEEEVGEGELEPAVAGSDTDEESEKE
jgi:predicted  nucleic acid-binding Zn-ribbon protein